MKTSDELESEYQLRRRNNPEESEEASRLAIFKLAANQGAELSTRIDSLVENIGDLKWEAEQIQGAMR